MKDRNEGNPLASDIIPTSLPQLHRQLEHAWSEDSCAFVEHWATLRTDCMMPTSEMFFDKPSTRFAPSLYVVELIGDVARVRLQGTALDSRWTTQLTGHDLHEGMSATVRRRSLENMRQIVAHPCGYLARNVYTTSLERAVAADLVQLPLSVKPGRPPRLVCLASMKHDEVMEETVADFRTEALAWLDLGAGVPGSPPRDLLE